MEKLTVPKLRKKIEALQKVFEDKIEVLNSLVEEFDDPDFEAAASGLIEKLQDIVCADEPNGEDTFIDLLYYVDNELSVVEQEEKNRNIYDD